MREIVLYSFKLLFILYLALLKVRWIDILVLVMNHTHKYLWVIKTCRLSCWIHDLGLLLIDFVRIPIRYKVTL